MGKKHLWEECLCCAHLGYINDGGVDRNLPSFYTNRDAKRLDDEAKIML